MELIYRDEAIKAINDVLMEDVRHRVWLKLRINNLKPVDAIQIEWLEEKLIGHPELPYAITDGISSVLDLWKAEQEEQNVGKDT